MKGFEQAFGAMLTFRFEDKESEANALWARSWILRSRREGGFRAPMVVITGPPGSGKSRLAAYLCRGLQDGDLIPAVNLKAENLAFAALQHAAVLLHEDCGRLQSKELERFITASHWTAKAWNPCVRRQTMEVFELSTVVLVTGAPSLILSEDLCRRAVFIRLRDRLSPFQGLAESMVATGKAELKLSRILALDGSSGLRGAKRAARCLEIKRALAERRFEVGGECYDFRCHRRVQGTFYRMVKSITG